MSTTSKDIENFKHDIKNVLAVIKGYTQILIKRSVNTTDKKSLSYLVKIDTKINELTQMLNNIKKYEKEKH